MADSDFDGLPALDGAVTAVAIIDDQLSFDVTIRWTVTPPGPG